MRRIRSLRPIAAALAALALSACAEAERYDAAGDIHALLVAVRNDDETGFDAHVDRKALKKQLRARLTAEAVRRAGGGEGAAALGAALAGPLADLATDVLVQPEAFRAVADYMGYGEDKPIPSALVIAQGLRRIDDDHVCVARSKGGPCVLVFADEDHVWRLTGFVGDLGLLRRK